MPIGLMHYLMHYLNLCHVLLNCTIRFRLFLCFDDSLKTPLKHKFRLVYEWMKKSLTSADMHFVVNNLKTLFHLKEYDYRAHEHVEFFR